MSKKILSFIICLLLVCSIGNAQDFFYVIEDFSGMMNSHTSKYLLGKNYAQQALNVRPNETYGSLVKRPKMLLLTTTPTAAIKTLYRYYKSDDTKYTIATYSTKVDYYDADGTAINLYASASDSKRWSCITYKDKWIGTNGTDNPKKWDGETANTDNTDSHRTAGDLITDLGAPFAELNTGANLDASSWYQYKIAFYDGSSYTYSDARSNPLKTGAAVRDITLTDIPLGATGTTQRIIYRTVGDASRAAVVSDTSFYRVATISDNSTTTYNDTMDDATLLGDSAPTWSTASGGTSVTPPKARFALIHKERIFLANDPSGTSDGKSTIYWSPVLKQDYFNVLVDYELIRADDGDEITFIKDVLGVLSIGKTRTVNKFYTTATDTANWSIATIQAAMGCVAPYSAVDALGGVIYLGRYGLYMFNGQTSRLISDTVTDKVRDILATSVEDVAGIFNDNRYLMSYTSEASGAANNDVVLIFDLIRNSYYEDSKSIDSFVNFDSGDDFGTLYSGSSESDGNIYAHKNAFNNLVYRYKSQLDSGTVDSVYVQGTEKDPYISLGDGELWSESTDNWEDSGSKTWMVNTLTGYWYSPTVQISATELDKLYWNESLGSYGSVTFAVKLAATEGALAGASWSSEFTDPSGSDLSNETANVWIQIRASLSSSVYDETPTVFLSDAFVIKMTYKKEGTTGETSILSIWESGTDNLGGGELSKRIKEMQVYYEGTSGTMTVEFDNSEGDEYNFDIDLSIDPTSSSTDNYFGTSIDKIYVHIPSFEDVPTGRHWTYKVSEDGAVSWTINRIITRGEANAYTTFK